MDIATQGMMTRNNKSDEFIKNIGDSKNFFNEKNQLKLINIWPFVGLPLLIFVMIFYVSAIYRIPKESDTAREWIEHTDGVLLKTQSLLSALTEMETAQRGYLLSHDRHYRAPLEDARTQSRMLVDLISHLTSDNPLQQQRMASLSSLVERKIAEIETADAQADQGNWNAALRIELADNGERLTGEIRQIIAAIIAEENRIGDIRRAEAKKVDRLAELFLQGGGGGLLALLLLVLCGWGLSQKRAAARTRIGTEQQRRLLSVLDMATTKIRDRNGTIRFWSSGCQDIYGYTAEEALGRNSHDLLGTTFPLPLDEIEKMLEDGGTWRGHLRRYAKDGREVLIAAHWMLYRAMADQSAMVVESDVDITESTRRTAELQSANQELDVFAYAVTHDLRAPLRAMRGFSHVLMQDYGEQFDEEGRLYLSQIDQAGRHMAELVDGVLALSRSVRGEVRPEHLDLSAMAKRLAATIAVREPERRVAWHIEPGLTAWGTIDMIELVLRNLLENAWKFTAHTPSAEIRFHAEREGDRQLFCVSDNGAGFDMAHAGRLFKPFQRLHRQDEFPGIGIGLATAQRIIRRHGGIIDARGAPGKGATFRFSLQLSPRMEN